MRIHVSIAVFIFTGALMGCRTVWVHENWEQDLFDRDYSECRAQAYEGRAVTKIHTRRCKVDSETGEETCIEEETRKRSAPRVNWKTCMRTRGWQTVTGSRSSPISRPKGAGASSLRRSGR